jgi:hypothetical protein
MCFDRRISPLRRLRRSEIVLRPIDQVEARNAIADVLDQCTLAEMRARTGPRDLAYMYYTRSLEIFARSKSRNYKRVGSKSDRAEVKESRISAHESCDERSGAGGVKNGHTERDKHKRQNDWGSASEKRPYRAMRN